MELTCHNLFQSLELSWSTPGSAVCRSESLMWWWLRIHVLEHRDKFFPMREFMMNYYLSQFHMPNTKKTIQNLNFIGEIDWKREDMEEVLRLLCAGPWHASQNPSAGSFEWGNGPPVGYDHSYWRLFWWIQVHDQQHATGNETTQFIWMA